MEAEKQTDSTAKPVSHEAFRELNHPSLRFHGIKRNLESSVNKSFQNKISAPLQNKAFKQWLTGSFPSKLIESLGLPRYSVEQFFPQYINFRVRPKDLNRLAVHKSSATQRRLSNFFIWDGDWDKNAYDFHTSSRYFFISDIWEHRHDLTRSMTYRRYVQLLMDGKPYRNLNKNHSGVLLNSRKKIYRYIEIYLSFMLSMKEHGYDPSVTNDPIGVGLDRDGNLVKTNKGLHRLAMAQVIGMESIEVRLRAVHREWWRKITNNIINPEDKFKKLTEHLRCCNLIF